MMVALDAEFNSMEIVCEKLDLHSYNLKLYSQMVKRFELELQVVDLYRESKTQSDNPFDHMLNCYRNYRTVKMPLSRTVKRLIDHYLDTINE